MLPDPVGASGIRIPEKLARNRLSAGCLHPNPQLRRRAPAQIPTGYANYQCGLSVGPAVVLLALIGTSEAGRADARPAPAASAVIGDWSRGSGSRSTFLPQRCAIRPIFPLAYTIFSQADPSPLNFAKLEIWHSTKEIGFLDASEKRALPRSVRHFRKNLPTDRSTTKIHPATECNGISARRNRGFSSSCAVTTTTPTASSAMPDRLRFCCIKSSRHLHYGTLGAIDPSLCSTRQRPSSASDFLPETIEIAKTTTREIMRSQSLDGRLCHHEALRDLALRAHQPLKRLGGVVLAPTSTSTCSKVGADDIGEIPRPFGLVRGTRSGAGEDIRALGGRPSPRR